MIDHLGIPVADLDASVAFYSAALAPLGYSLLMQFPGVAGFGRDGKPDFWIGGGAPSAQTAKPGSLHLAFHADSAAMVDGFYAAALAAGATDNGAPGLRPQYHARYYGAFVIDLNGLNLEAVCHNGA